MSTVWDLMAERGEAELPMSPGETLSTYKSLVGSKGLIVSGILSYLRAFESFGTNDEAVAAMIPRAVICARQRSKCHSNYDVDLRISM